MVIKLSEPQLRAFMSPKRIIMAVGGLQSGKTMCGALWMRKKISDFGSVHDDNFLVLVPTYKILSQSTLITFLKYHQGLGKYNKGDNIFNMIHGSKVIFRSMDNPHAAEGITNVRAILIDEGLMLNDEQWLFAMGRSSFLQAQIFISSTPYRATGWGYELYEAWKSGKRDDIDVIQWSSADNPTFPLAEFNHQREIMDPRLFALRYLGTFQKMEGLVYPDFDHDNLCDPFLIDKSFTITGGIDFGYTDDFACCVTAIQNDGKKVYVIEEHKKSGMSISDQVRVVKQLQQIYNINVWYADSASPQMIAHFQSCGLNVQPAKKGPGSVEYGISYMQQLIRTKVLQLFRGKCLEMEKEFSMYSYKNFLAGVNNIPLDGSDHILDAARYNVTETKYLLDDFLQRKSLPIKSPLQLLSEAESDTDWYND
jgi:phage terminase large subunit